MLLSLFPQGRAATLEMADRVAVTLASQSACPIDATNKTGTTRLVAFMKHAPSQTKFTNDCKPPSKAAALHSRAAMCWINSPSLNTVISTGGVASGRNRNRHAGRRLQPRDVAKDRMTGPLGSCPIVRTFAPLKPARSPAMSLFVRQQRSPPHHSRHQSEAARLT